TSSPAFMISTTLARVFISKLPLSFAVGMVVTIGEDFAPHSQPNFSQKPKYWQAASVWPSGFVYSCDMFPAGVLNGDVPAASQAALKSERSGVIFIGGVGKYYQRFVLQGFYSPCIPSVASIILYFSSSPHIF